MRIVIRNGIEFLSRLKRADQITTSSHSVRPAKARESADGSVAAFYQSGLRETMAALELTYCRRSRATEASIDGKETIATTILDYLDVEKALHRLDVFDPVRCSSF